MKKFIVLLTSLLITFSLSSCGTNQGTNQTDSETTTEVATTVEQTTVDQTTVDQTTVEQTTVMQTTVEPTNEEPTTIPKPKEQTSEKAKEDDEKIQDNNSNVSSSQKLSKPEYQEKNSLNLEKYLGTWGNTGEIGRGFTVFISSVDGNQIECIMNLSGSIGHMAGTPIISMTIENDVAYFNYSDSWSNKGAGSLTFEDESIHLNAEITERGEMGYGFTTGGQNVELTKISDSTANPFL